jgi:hypothetical protein
MFDTISFGDPTTRQRRSFGPDLTICPGHTCEAFGYSHRHCALDAGVLRATFDADGNIDGFEDALPCSDCDAWMHAACAYHRGDRVRCIDDAVAFLWRVHV